MAWQKNGVDQTFSHSICNESINKVESMLPTQRNNKKVQLLYQVFYEMQVDALKATLLLRVEPIFVRASSSSHYSYAMHFSSSTFSRGDWMVCKRFSQFHAFKKAFVDQIAASKCSACAATLLKPLRSMFPKKHSWRSTAWHKAGLTQRAMQLHNVLTFLLRYVHDLLLSSHHHALPFLTRSESRLAVERSDVQHDCTHAMVVKYALVLKQFLQFPMAYEREYLLTMNAMTFHNGFALEQRQERVEEEKNKQKVEEKKERRSQGTRQDPGNENPADENLVNTFRVTATNMCAICLGAWGSRSSILNVSNNHRMIHAQADVVETSCGHYFHQRCMQTWLRTRLDCPLCRHTMKTERKKGKEGSEGTE